MKKQVLVLISFILLSGHLFSQSPQAFKYQAIVRNINGNVLVNQQVSFMISILQGSPLGIAVYAETHVSITNEFGMVNLSIGEGTIVSGSFPGIDWSNGPYFLKVEFDPLGGGAFVLMGVSQLQSVPYALYANNAGTSFWVLNAADISNINQGNVGIGLINPLSKLGVAGSLSVGNNFSILLAPIDGALIEGNVKIGSSNVDPDPEESKLYLENMNGGTRSTLSFRNNAGGHNIVGRIEARDGGWRGMQTVSAKGHIWFTQEGITARLDSLRNAAFGSNINFTVLPSARLRVDGITAASNNFLMPWGTNNPLGQLINASVPGEFEVTGLLSTADGANTENNSIVTEAGISAYSNIGLLARVTNPPINGESYALYAFDVVNDGVSTWAAKILGRLNLSDGTQGEGKVLTSDAWGNAAWQDQIIPKVSFKAYSLPPTSIPNYTSIPITAWVVVDFEEGGANYNPGTGEYTIPVTGLYSIGVSIAWSVPATNGNACIGVLVNSIYLDYTINDISTSTHIFTGAQFNTVTQLSAGDVVQVFVTQNTGNDLLILSDGGLSSNKFFITLLH